MATDENNKNSRKRSLTQAGIEEDNKNSKKQKLIETESDDDEDMIDPCIDDNTNNKSNNKIEPLTFLKIPSDLKYNLFQYLHENDLYSLEKTCRSVCIDARNPNSLYYINLKKFTNVNNY
eukprot:455919_1